MITVVDIGNSYLKMARWDGERLTAHQRVRHRDLLGADWQSGLEDARMRGDSVYIASVADQSVEQVFEAWLLSRGHDLPIYLKSVREACGVRNAYRKPRNLGVDRWCAMIAARVQQAGPLCVVDAGTAMTVDWVDGDGRHRGGLIMPGPTLQGDSLFTGTRHVHVGSGLPNTMFADNTEDAVISGVCYGCASLIETAVQSIAEDTGETPALFLTGGEADRIMPLLKTPAVVEQDLVLRGVVCLAAESGE